MLCKLALAVTAALVAMVLSPHAVAQGGAGGGRAYRTQPIRAGVIINPSAAGNSSAAPFAWYNLDAASSVKPPEWTFVNPNNEGTVAQDTYVRWRQIDPSINTTAYQTKVNNGLRTQKRYASYWEVDLRSTTDADLAQYDVLLFAPLGPVQLNPAERGRLNRFVDGGGVLWVDYDPRNGTTIDGANSFPIPFATVQHSLPFSGVQNDTFHPIFNFPLPIGGNDLARLDAQWDGQNPNSPPAVGIEWVTELSGMDDFFQTVTRLGDYARLRPVSQYQKGGRYFPTAMVGKVGDGYQVVTVRQIAQKLNRTAPEASIDTNRRFIGQEPRLSAEGLAAAKFAVNLVGLTSSAPQFGSGSRKGFASGIDIGAPLLNRYSAPYNNGTITGPIAAVPTDLRPPVIYKGLVAVTLDNTVSVYDADPSRDSDGDGDPDDGLRDLSVGAARDLIFQTAPFGTKISSATVAEVIDVVGGAPRDQLLVTDETGRMAIYPIYGPVVAGRRQWPTVAGTFVAPSVVINGGGNLQPATVGPTVFAPTVYGSFAYIVDSQQVALGNLSARLRVVDLRTGTPLAFSGTNFVAGGLNNVAPAPSGPATVGQIPIADNSGGSDVVAYVPVRATTGVTTTGPGFVSYWIGAKGEKPFLVDLNSNGTGTTVTVTTRASSQGELPIVFGNGPLGFRMTIQKSNGTVYTPAEMSALITSGPSIGPDGKITFQIMGTGWPTTGPNAVDQDNPLRVDYTIDWGRAAAENKTAAIERARISFSSPSGGTRRLIGGLALGPQGTLFATVATQQVPVASTSVESQGTVYALKEEGRGSFKMLWRWDLYPRHTLNYEGGTVTYESSLPDNDPVQNLAFGGFSLRNVLGGRFTDTTIQGAPVVRGDKVFVTVSGRKSLSPSSAVLCFAADPPSPEIRTDLDLSNGFAIVQPDFARSTDFSNPRTQSILVSNSGGNESVFFDKAANGVGGVIRFNSLTNVRSGQIVDSISLSQPVLLRRTGQGDVLIEPSSQGTRWSPLLWYTILHGTRVYGPAYAAGNTLYMSGSSFFPQFIVDGSAGGIPQYVDGFITAIRTDVDTTNALPTTQAFTTNAAQFSPQSVVLDAERPWMRQLISLDYPRATNAFSSSQSADNQLFSSPYFVMPQNPRNTDERGRFSFDDYRTRVLQAIIPPLGARFLTNDVASYGVVGGDKTLVTWNQRGSYAFTRSDFWIADEGRIAKIDASGNVLFDSRASLHQGDSGQSAAANVLPLVRPTRVVPVAGDDDLLVVDTGANKILRMDPSGIVSREIKEFRLDSLFVPNGFRNNAPLTFKNPRDATTFTTRVLAAENQFSNPSPVEEWVHTLIADEGNNRLVELVDRIELDPATYERVGSVGERGTLLWQSPAQVSGKGYDYVSVSRVRIPDNGLNPDGTPRARYAIVAGLGSFAPGRQDAGEVAPADGSVTPSATPATDLKDSLGGGIVVFDSQLPAGVAVYSSIEAQVVPNIHRWDDRRDTVTNDLFKDLDGLNDEDDGWSTVTGNTPALPDNSFYTKRLSGVSSVTASVVVSGGTPVIAVMIADRTGVYEAIPVPAGTAGDPNRTVLQTRWMITNEAYRAMRRATVGAVELVSSDSPSALRATFARRLDDENVLLVNGFLGKTQGRWNAAGTQTAPQQTFNGEVVQLDGRIAVGVTPRGNISDGYNVQNDNLGFGSRSVKVRFGILEGARGILQPVYADRR